MAADEAPNLNLSPDEKRTYGQLFRQADSESVGVVVGEIAVRFFHKTGLDSRILGEIWQIADKENRGFLTPAGFGIALRLIGHAQAGREPTPEIALQQAPLPRFDGIAPQPTGGIPPPPPVPVSSPPPPAALQAQSTGGPIRIPPLTPEKVTQYTGLFERQPLQNGQLPGDQARGIFEKSGLPNEALGRIWQLADVEQRGALVLTEFIIAMHLLTSMKTGALRSLPSVLPPGLYEAASRRGPVPRQSSTGPGISAIPRQLSGTAQVRTNSPLGRPPMSPQQSGASDWAVTPADKARFDQIYADLDKGNKGYITGEEAVPFFSQSNLPEDSLAQIWDLADTNSQGQLSREQFAVAMYLIRQQRTGRSVTLPTTLPANLIPPSLRSQPKSALDDLFGLDSGSSTPAPPPPAQAPMSTGGSNANDPFAGGSSFTPTSPGKPSLTGNGGSSFKPFVPSSSFGRGLTQHPTGGSTGSGQKLSAPSASEDLLSDNDEASKNISEETTELANLSNQISSLSKQTQDVQAKRTTTQNELGQATSQKQNFEQRLAQLRSLYEKEAQDTRALEEQLSTARKETSKLQAECMTLEGTYRDVQAQHQKTLEALQSDKQENTNLRERIRVVNGEIAQLKPQIEKLKSEARQQKGLVAINKKQLSTTEGERDKLKMEAEDLGKSIDDLRQANTSSPVSVSAQIASPAASVSSANNPFFRRTASTDIMGAFASPPPTKNASDKSFDDLFGPAFPPSSSATPPLLLNPESRQISSSFLPFPDQTDSLSSSRQVSPPASRNDDPLHGSITPVPGDFKSSDSVGSVPGAFPGDDLDKSESKDTLSTPNDAPREATKDDESKPADSADPFGGHDEAKAKADFENAFAAFTTAKTQSRPSPEANKSSAFDSEFPPISELERDEEEDSDSSSDNGGFDDNFTPASPPAKPAAEGSPELTHAAPDSTSPQPAQEANSPKSPRLPETSAEQPSSPATITETNAQKSSVDDIFGAAATGTAPVSQQAAPSNPPQNKGGFEDLDSDFEGLEDAKEGSADEDFANISRSGLDDFNPVFDSSPPGSQAKTESTAFGNESFDFVSASSTGPTQPAAGPQQQKAPEAHDWDAIFSGFDSPSAAAAQPAPADKPEGPEPHPGQQALNRTFSTESEHDDPILKSLTSMGYKRSEALDALEKYDYDLDKAANFLASRS
ncbi:putative calcium-binding protein [Fusarium culmorum]|uniref:Putative calcium-binding protein n=1 Tax=Fusarium culmorum TaxID=5516 RepID=A0A2T4GMM4_FUSCU|nr:putative calcium-binding protein [Fusarium culmorum]